MADDLPAPENGVIDGVNAFLKGAVDLGATAAKAALVAASPVFGWPVISQVVDYLLFVLKTYVLKALQDNTTFLIISVEEARNYHAYMDELANLKKAQQSEDLSDDDQALEAARKALGDLIVFHS